MNIIILSVVIFLGIFIFLVFISYMALGIVKNDTKLKNFSIALLLMIIEIIYIYSILNYLGKIDNPIKQGIFKPYIYKVKEVFDYNIPVLKIKNPTDSELYEQEVNKLNAKK